MNINRNNYETYFLLYIDNELSATERTAVEAFIAIHTDLKEELMQLQDVVLPADDIVFAGKADLLKCEAEDKITERLLLHIDGELSTAEATETDKMIAANATLQTEWDLLQRTKLDASEKIIFADKNLLYRKERDNVVIGRFTRWAVAAAVLGFGFFAAISVISNKKQDNNAVATKTVPVKKNLENIVTKESLQPLNKIEELAEEKKNVAIKQAAKKQATEKQTRLIDKTDNNSLANNKTAPKKTVVITLQNDNINQQQVLIASNKKNQQLEKTSPERTDNELAITVPKKRAEIIDKNILIPENNTLASTASLTSEPNNDRILFMNEEDVSNSKAGSFFRKLKRTVERKTKIKTGNNLKIAGFEIALN